MIIFDQVKKYGTYFANGISHFETIREHRKLVREGCFKVGLYFQGITHDLSKYSPTEFMVGVQYFQGFRSPNNAERENKGYSAAWLHHKGRNKHHFEYWLDYSSIEHRSDKEPTGIVPTRMPNRYLVEMYMDRVAASKTYNKEKYTDEYPLLYYLKGKTVTPIEKHTADELEKLLRMLALRGERATQKYIRKKLLRGYPGAIIAEWIDMYKNKKGRTT